MKNTAHFGVTPDGTLIPLGVGVNTKAVANLLADNVESIGAQTANPINIVALLDIDDLYKLKAQIGDLLNNLPNEQLAGEPVTFGLTEES